MKNVETHSERVLAERLRDLREWALNVLWVAERRDITTVVRAQIAFVAWAVDVWSGSQDDTDEALVEALTAYMEAGLGWLEGKGDISLDLNLTADPPWRFEEFFLVVMFALSDMSIRALKVGTKRKLAVAAVLHGDVIHARELWQGMRGPARARNPDTKLGEIHRRIGKLDTEVAVREDRSTVAREKAKAKHSKDPIQRAKSCVKELWPLALKRGWTVERMHMEISTRGHAAKQDTVRKWMGKLRRTGTC